MMLKWGSFDDESFKFKKSSRYSIYTTTYALNICVEAIFYCPTMTSHRPRSQNTSKEQALIPEKESRRT
jgi:hypothetical protein